MQIKKGFSQIIYLLAGISIYVAVLKTQILNEKVYNVICLSVIAQCLLAVTQLWLFDPVVYFMSHFVAVRGFLARSIIVGSFGNPNFLAAYLAISLPFFFRRKWCYFIPVIAMLLFTSKTSAAVIPAVIGVAIYYWHTKLGYFYFRGRRINVKWIILFSGGLAALGYAVWDGTIFMYSSNPEVCRYSGWWELLKQFNSVKEWLFGFGPGARWGHNFPLHNEWLSMLHLYGLIGLIFIGGFIITIDRSNRMLFTSLVIICLNMGANYPLHLAPSVFLIIIVVGLMQRGKYGRLHDIR